MPLALVGNRIQEAVLIAPDQLRQLSIFICNNLNFHDIGQVQAPGLADRDFERQYDAQGYCDICRDFAGRILGRFEITDRNNTNRRFELAAKLRADLSRENNGFLSIEEANHA